MKLSQERTESKASQKRWFCMNTRSLRRIFWKILGLFLFLNKEAIGLRQHV
jgi:hypothetical protein